MPPKKKDDEATPAVPKFTRRDSANTSSPNGVENPIDPDAPREGRLASLKPRPTAATRGAAPKITFKPKAVQRRKKDGATDSLLSTGGADDEGPSDARLRRAERGRGRGRGRGAGRVEAPLVASGPFAQGPAAGPPSTRGRGPSRISQGGRSGVQTQESASSGRSTTAKREKLTKEEFEEEANLDDAGNPMQNLLKMKDSSDFWAPITTERIERAQKEAQIAQPGQEGKTIKVKKEAVDLGFVDVKTEPTESTLTSRMPSPEPENSDQVMQGVETTPQAKMPAGDDSDDDDIMLPGIPQTKPATTPDVKPKQEKKEIIKVMTAEEAEEQERLSSDLDSLRLNLTRGDQSSSTETGQLIFIQLPEVLPFWKPGPDDEKDDGFIKEEKTNHEIVEIDQKAEDSRPVKVESTESEDVALPSGQDKDKKNLGDSKQIDLSQEASGAERKTENKTEETAPVYPPKKKKKKQKPIPFPPPEGLLGQIHIHRSGKITCNWGGIVMDVGTGSDCGFLQEVVAIDTKTDKKAWSLGRVGSRVMMSPNLDDLLGSQG